MSDDEDAFAEEEARSISRRKTDTREISRGTPGSDQAESDDEYVGDGEEDEDEEEGMQEVEDWDHRKRSDFAKRERRREKAMAVKASTWIKAKDKEKRIKSKLICLSERGPRKTWDEAWKALADECSNAVVRKIREITGTNIKQDWLETPRKDEDGNPMMVIYFSSEAGMKDQRNVKFAKRVVELIRQDEKEWPNLTAPGRHYISDKFLMGRVSKAFHGFKRAWKAQTDEDLAQTIANSARTNRILGRQMTAAQNLHKGAKVFIERWCREDEEWAPTAAECRKLMKIGKQVIAAEWMSETESGPEDASDRREWLKKLGKTTNARGKRTTCYDVKGKGAGIFEVLPVTWRSEEYQWYIEQCQEAFEKEHRVRTVERVYREETRSKLSRYPAPTALVDAYAIEDIKREGCWDEEDVLDEWGKDHDEDVAWFMTRVAQWKQKLEGEAAETVE
ncbi:hypothetical protein FRC00_003507 [Tulasnella sp. 408]|nr:hypothetical protein FRC00_003507 [Tulasnella sp. 408]